jgi:hypothetical protein
LLLSVGTWWHSWLLHSATSQQVMGLIPDGVTGVFIDLILPTTLWPWGQLILWQKWVPGMPPEGLGSRCIGLKTLLPTCANCLEIPGAWSPRGLLRPVQWELYVSILVSINCFWQCLYGTGDSDWATYVVWQVIFSFTLFHLHQHTSAPPYCSRSLNVYSVAVLVWISWQLVGLWLMF